MTRQLFISYRREDSLGSTGRLYDRLRAHFKDHEIFIDVDTISPGEDFVEAVKRAVESCDLLIAVIGNKWLKISDKNSNRLLDDDGDFVRTEIRAALQRKIKVIPVLVENASMPDSVDLPADLKTLAHINAIEISHTRFNNDVDRLIKLLEKYIRQAESATEKVEALKPTHDMYGDKKRNITPLPTIEADISDQQEQTGNDFSKFSSEPSLNIEQSVHEEDDSILRAAKEKNIKKYVFIAVGVLIMIFAIWKFITPAPDRNSAGMESNAADQAAIKTDTSQMPIQENLNYDTATMLQGETTPSKVVKDEVAAVENKINDDEKIFSRVEVEAAFPGGASAFTKYITRVMSADINEITESDLGTCMVKFMVDKTGKVDRVEAMTMKGTKLAEIATDAIRKGPNWTPAQQNGRYVNAYRLQPITLSNPDK